MMTGLPSYGEDVEALIVANRWPDEWTHHYRANRYFLDDPVSQWSFAKSVPFTWADARAGTADTARTRQIKEHAKDLGMVDGIAFPMFDPHNWQAVVSLASDAPVTLTKKETGVIYLASVMAQSQVSKLSDANRNAQQELTVREKDVLTWMAHGKSLWETATILGISEATVKIHLAAIRTKLGATNTTHAVARGLRSRQIQL
jgi:LuxR family quorum sensing-dependent transcriptional regulator